MFEYTVQKPSISLFFSWIFYLPGKIDNDAVISLGDIADKRILQSE